MGVLFRYLSIQKYDTAIHNNKSLMKEGPITQSALHDVVDLYIFCSASTTYVSYSLFLIETPDSS